MVFSPPKSLIDRFRFSSDVRYVQQWVRRNAEEKRDEERERERERTHERRRRREPNTLQEDWNVYAGNVGTVGAGRYPAKFSFDVTTANCATATQPDFVAWNTSLGGSSNPVAAEDTGTFSAAATLGSSITITNGTTTLTMTASLITLGPGTFAAGGSATASASGLAASINTAGNGSSVGISATSSGATVTVTATTAGTSGNNITVTASSGILNPSNLTWTFPHLVDGATGVASIVAFDNLYSSCTPGTVPSPYWAYNTGGTASNSVTLSLDGKQVAFVQSQGTAASLVILKWAASSGAVNTPVNLTTQASAAAYRACTAPCMYTIAFSGGRNDTNSSPYYDIDTDTIYVGDDPATRGTTHSTLHKFTGVFSGNPAEVMTSGWPITMGTEILTSPVYDAANNQVYVADSNSSGPTGGFLYRVDGTAGTVVTSARLAEGGGFVEGPVLDAVNGTVYLYSSAGGTIGCSPPITGVNSVYQMGVGFAAGTGSVTSAQVSGTGTCSATLPLYAGDFDNAYYSTGTGHLYVCGNIGGNPTLYQVSVSSAAGLGTVTTGPNVASAATGCSPVTEFDNVNATGGAKDWIFLSTQASAVTGSPINCPAPSGCIMSFDVTSGLPISTTLTATAARATVAGGASGVIIDNSATAAGASEVYFTPLAPGTCTTSSAQGIGGCAVQASQAGLM